MNRLYYQLMSSPVGQFLVAGTDQALHFTGFEGGRQQAWPRDTWINDSAPLRFALDQFESYFDREPVVFDMPLVIQGTPFQNKVWHALQQIEYGQTASYGEVARMIGRPTASRAVGAANGANPLPVVVPCHRVIGADAGLTGFGGGLAAKRVLLELEGISVAPEQQPLFPF